jgi:hypothetical protein
MLVIAASLALEPTHASASPSQNDGAAMNQFSLRICHSLKGRRKRGCFYATRPLLKAPQSDQKLASAAVILSLQVILALDNTTRNWWKLGEFVWPHATAVRPFAAIHGLLRKREDPIELHCPISGSIGLLGNEYGNQTDKAHWPSWMNVGFENHCIAYPHGQNSPQSIRWWIMGRKSWSQTGVSSIR